MQLFEYSRLANDYQDSHEIVTPVYPTGYINHDAVQLYPNTKIDKVYS